MMRTARNRIILLVLLGIFLLGLFRPISASRRRRSQPPPCPYTCSASNPPINNNPHGLVEGGANVCRVSASRPEMYCTPCHCGSCAACRTEEYFILECCSGYQQSGDSCPIEIPCNEAPLVPNGFHKPVQPSYAVGSKVTYTCYGHYTMVGSNEMTCVVGPSWSPSKPLCVPTPCIGPPVAANASVTPSQALYAVGSSVRLMCRSGYRKTSGDATKVCHLGNRWTGADIVCKPRLLRIANQDMSSALVGKEFAWVHHLIAGAIYVLAGCACFLNHSRTLSMLSNSKLFSAKSRVAHLHFNVASIGAVAGFPLAAVSCFAGKWMWGDWMCQAYAFEGFVFGVAVVQFVCFIMVDRFLATCQPDFYAKLSSGFFNFICLCIWAVSASWAALPLFGYGKYGREPQGTSCTIDWMAKDEMYYTYMTSLVMIAFVVPSTISVFCYILTFDRPVVPNEKNDKEERLTCQEMNQIARLFFIVTFCSWSGYAVVSVWSLLTPIARVPLLLAYVPPIMAKLGLAFSPLIYSSVSQKCHMKRGGAAPELKKD